MRGVGKTSLLADITSNLVKKDNWIIVYLAMTNDLLETLIQIIYREAGSKIKKALNIQNIKLIKSHPLLSNYLHVKGQLMYITQYYTLGIYRFHPTNNFKNQLKIH